MLPMKPVREQLGKLLAADATTLAPAVLANEVALIQAPFVPNENMVVADLTLADFTGSAPISGTPGAQLEGIDPDTGDQEVTISAPLGGWRWETTALTNLPQTIYGFALTNSTGATLLGVYLLEQPVTLTVVNQVIDLGKVSLKITASPFI